MTCWVKFVSTQPNRFQYPEHVIEVEASDLVMAEVLAWKVFRQDHPDLTDTYDVLQVDTGLYGG